MITISQELLQATRILGTNLIRRQLQLQVYGLLVGFIEMQVIVDLVFPGKLPIE